ncbi:MAG: transposase [Planctomycetota bacterium]|nr:transposase [Planctomycetaceae bacterium]MDQ3329543.1 transposase [Planctomycetota bacterium]
MLPPCSGIGRRRTTDLRTVVSAIRYQSQTGCPWRKLPPEFQPWNTVYGYFHTWCHDGTLRKLRPVLNSLRASANDSTPRRLGPPPVRLNPDRETFACRTAGK